MDDLLVERVLRAVEQVPAGRVVSYGDVAELVGTGPRQVGRVMREYGQDVCWWRVVNAAGDAPEHLVGRAGEHWASEGIGFKPNRRGCRIAQYRADREQWAHAYAKAVADLSDWNCRTD